MLSQFIDLYYYFHNIIMRYTFEYILSACLNYHILTTITFDLNNNVNTTWLMSQMSWLKVFQTNQAKLDFQLIILTSQPDLAG